jgi:hypothetical protein
MKSAFVQRAIGTITTEDLAAMSSEQLIELSNAAFNLCAVIDEHQQMRLDTKSAATSLSLCQTSMSSEPV